MNTEYSKEYFIKKFEAIPEEEIGTTALSSKCALYHCGVRDFDSNGAYILTDEAKALIELFSEKGEVRKGRSMSTIVTDVNDGIGNNYPLGETAKERLLNKLKSL